MKNVNLQDIINYTEVAAVKSEVNGDRILTPNLVDNLKADPDAFDIWIYKLSKLYKQNKEPEAKRLLLLFENCDVASADDFYILDDLLQIVDFD